MRILSTLLIVMLAGCPPKGTTTASPGGAATTPEAVCPPGTIEDSSSDAQNDCAGKAGVDVKNASGDVSGHCVSKAGSVVKCKPDATICGDSGVKRITSQGVECKESATINQRAGDKSQVAGRDIIINPPAPERQEEDKRLAECKNKLESFSCDGAGHYNLTKSGTYSVRIDQVSLDVTRGPKRGTRLVEFSLHANPEGTKIRDLIGAAGAVFPFYSDGNKNFSVCSKEPGTGGGCSGACASTGSGAILTTSGGASVILALSCQ